MASRVPGIPVLGDTAALVRRWAGPLGRFASAQVAVQAVGFLSGIVLVRTLAVDQYAYLTIAASIQGTQNVLTDVGMTSSLTALGARCIDDRHRLSRLMSTALALRRRMAGWVVLATTPVLLWLLREGGAGWTQSALLTAALLLGLWFSLDVATLIVVVRLRQETSRLQWLELAGAVTRLGLILAALPVRLDALVAQIAAGLALAVQWHLVRRWTAGRYEPSAMPNPEDRQALTRMIRSQAANGIYFCLQGQISIWLITLLGTQSAIAGVGALGRLAAIFAVSGAVTAGVVLPRFARCEGRAALRRRYLQVVAIYLACGAFVVFAVAALPREAVWILGEHYRHLGPDAPFAVASAVLSSLLALMWHMNAYRGWVSSSWIYVPATILAQALLVPLLELSSVRGVILFGALSALPALAISIWLAVRGLRSEPEGGAPGPAAP